MCISERRGRDVRCPHGPGLGLASEDEGTTRPWDGLEVALEQHNYYEAVQKLGEQHIMCCACLEAASVLRTMGDYFVIFFANWAADFSVFLCGYLPLRWALLQKNLL